MPTEDNFAQTSHTESSARLWALEPKVRALAETDPAFKDAFMKDPLGAVRQHFGDAAMPSEGERVETFPGGGFALVFPKTKAYWRFGGDELSDEMLEIVSAGTGADCGNGESGQV